MITKMYLKLIGGFILVQWMCLIQPTNTLFVNKRSLTENIHNGLVFAGKIFGIDHASEIADLVAKTFSQNYKQPKQQKRHDNLNNSIDYNNQNTLMVSNILQIIGLDSAKIGALAVNGIIFIAQVIGRTLVSTFAEKFDSRPSNLPPISKRSQSSGSPLDWILENKSPVLATMLQEIRNSSLPQRLVEMLSSMDNGNGNADCVKLLMCKTSPLIWGMQRACNDSIDPDYQIDEIEENKSTRLSGFFKYLPEMQEFSYHGDACESRYDGCQILPDE